jgi:hypothetical protein
MVVTGERYQARANVTYPDGFGAKRSMYWGFVRIDLGDTPPTSEAVIHVAEEIADIQRAYREKGSAFTLGEPQIFHQEEHTRRILGIPLHTWHTLEVTPAVVEQAA